MHNRSMPAGDVIPELPYLDAAEASAWLCGAFGFRERLRIAGHRIQISVGSGSVVAVQVEELAGSCSVMVRVADVDAHYRTAVAYGAQVSGGPATFPYGERQYSARDLAGHGWVFSQTVADIDPDDWGGQLNPSAGCGLIRLGRRRLRRGLMQTFWHHPTQGDPDMGAWSHEPFGNDTACDWAYGLDGQRDFSLVAKTIQAVLDNGPDYLDSDLASEAIAAAEVLAKALGRGTQTDSYTGDVDAWVKSIAAKPSQDLLSKANEALARIMAPDSELRELWEESDDFANWQSSIKALQSAVGA